MQLAMDGLGSLGPLNFARVSGTPLCAVFMADEEDPFTPLACLNPAECKLLEGLAGTAYHARSEPGFSQVIGQLPPQPRILQVSAAYPSGGQPTLVVALLDGSRPLVDFPFPMEAAARLAGLAQVASEPAPGGNPALVAAVSETHVRLQDEVGNARDFATVQEFSHALGPEGEYLQMGELQPGDRVECWVQGSLLLRAEIQRAPRPWPPPTVAADALAQEGDWLNGQGRFAEGLERQMDWLEGIVAHHGGEFGPFTAARFALAVLYRKVLALQFSDALTVWQKKQPHPILVPGVDCLEQGQVGAREYILYQMLAGYLTSLAGDAAGVHKRLSHAAEVARQHEPGLLTMILRNWQLHVEAVPPAWNALREHCPRVLIPRIPTFPAPGPWVRPS